MPTIVTRKTYFDSAFELLSKRGFKDLKVVKLCKAMGVTTGSFYNYFRNLEDFVSQFLTFWRQELTKQLIEAAESIDEPEERLGKLVALAVTVPHEGEAAIRAWSKVDPAVHAAQEDVDELRLGLIRRAVLNASPGDPEADRLAELGLSIVVGMQQIQSPVNLNDLKWALEQYVQMVLARRHQDAAETAIPSDTSKEFLPAPRRYTSVK